MEKVTKRITTREVTEYIIKCHCGKKIIGSKESQVIYLLTVHQMAKIHNSKYNAAPGV